MKTITINEFKTMAARDDWRREQDYEVVDRIDRQVEEWDEASESPKVTDIQHAWGWASKTSTLDGVKIVYTEGFNYDECEPDSLSTGTEGQDKVWSVEGVAVLDEDGDPMSADDLADYLGSDFRDIDYSVLGIEQVTDIDTDEESEMDTFTLEIYNAPNLRFTGELVAHAASSDNQAAGSYYSGQTGCWAELTLYKTVGGRFVCYRADRTRWQGDRDRCSGKVCETLEDVKEFFGHGWLAKELYYGANIEDVADVE